MKYFSEKLTGYIVKSGVVPEESYAIYQYGFQIGLEMLSCLLVCFGIAVYLHMIPGICSGYRNFYDVTQFCWRSASKQL